MADLYAVPDGPHWVRWGEVAGKTAWRLCLAVCVMDGWLVLQQAEGPDLLIPQHIVRGHVEVSQTDPRSQS